MPVGPCVSVFFCIYLMVPSPCSLPCSQYPSCSSTPISSSRRGRDRMPYLQHSGKYCAFTRNQFIKAYCSMTNNRIYTICFFALPNPFSCSVMNKIRLNHTLFVAMKHSQSYIQALTVHVSPSNKKHKNFRLQFLCTGHFLYCNGLKALYNSMRSFLLFTILAIITKLSTHKFKKKKCSL